MKIRLKHPRVYYLPRFVLQQEIRLVEPVSVHYCFHIGCILYESMQVAYFPTTCDKVIWHGNSLIKIQEGSRSSNFKSHGANFEVGGVISRSTTIDNLYSPKYIGSKN